MAEPPAPAISSAAATGAASRTMARTTAAPVADSAPSWRVSWPTCSEMVAPSGMAMSITGRRRDPGEEPALLEALPPPVRMSHVLRNPSAATATIPPV